MIWNDDSAKPMLILYTRLEPAIPGIIFMHEGSGLTAKEAVHVCVTSIRRPP